jgi:hypothetical protein
MVSDNRHSGVCIIFRVPRNDVVTAKVRQTEISGLKMRSEAVESSAFILNNRKCFGLYYDRRQEFTEKSHHGH